MLKTDLLARINSLISEIDVETPEERNRIQEQFAPSFRSAISCEADMQVCDDNEVYTLTIDADDYGTYRYACSFHLIEFTLELAQKLENKRNDKRYDQWEARQAIMEQRLQELTNDN